MTCQERENKKLTGLFETASNFSLQVDEGDTEQLLELAAEALATEELLELC